MLKVIIPLMLVVAGMKALYAIFSSSITWTIISIIVLAIMTFKIYEYFYYKSEKFEAIKNNFQDYVKNCNDLNDHIEELKQTYTDIKKINYGIAKLDDSSRYNFKRVHQVNSIKSDFIYECSATVCKNAENQPFKYLCKYFSINADESTLEDFENVLNNFSAAEEGKILLKNELDEIKNSMKNDIPLLISSFSMEKFMSKLGFHEVDFKTVYFPVYSFRYVSPGGNKSTSCDIRLDIQNLNNFIEYLSELVKFKKSAAGQRALMTSKLREFIKQRDQYTCQNCGLSTSDEANLLLEIDHVIPIAKGGISTEDNLQTLCWKCNRTKGAKIYNLNMNN